MISLKKWLIILLYLAMIFLAYVNKDEIFVLLKESRLPVVLVIGIAAFVSFSSILPYSIVIGILGFSYGPLWGACLSWAGSLIAAIFTYGMVRFILAKQGRSFLSRYPRLERFAEVIEYRPFLTILLFRFIPVLPQNAVSMYAGLSSIPVTVFVSASAIGKIPVMLVYSFIGGSLFVHRSQIILVVTLYAVFLLGVYRVYKISLNHTKS